jgi:hypothetical protein
MHVIFEWDEAKRRANLARHGVDFAAMERFDWSGAVIRQDRRRDYGEVRLRAMGLIDGRLHEAVFTPRGHKVRIISLRKANARERRIWDAR